MTFRTNIFAGLLALALLGLPTAWGLELYQTQTWVLSDLPNPPQTEAPYEWSSANNYLGVNGFDYLDDLEFLLFDGPSSLPFRRVELILSGYYEGTASVTNNDATATPVTLSLSGSQNLTIDPPGTPVLSLTVGQLAYSTVVEAPANATTDFTLTTPTVTATKIYTGLDVEAFRNPPATIKFLLELAAHVFANPIFEEGKQITANYTGLVYSTVTLKYYVPEPGTGVVLGLAALALVRRRRR